jgi:hypothetical protein
VGKTLWAADDPTLTGQKRLPGSLIDRFHHRTTVTAPRRAESRVRPACGKADDGRPARPQRHPPAHDPCHFSVP